MIRYVLKRLLMLIPTLLVIVFIVFFIMNLIPSNPGTMILGENATEEGVAAFNEKVGYNKPFFVRYFNYVLDACRGDLGHSWRTGRPVIEEVAKRFPVTGTLAIGAVLIGLIGGVGIGIISAVKQYSALDITATALAMLLASFPAFWLGMILILVFSLYLKLLPSYGIGNVTNYIMPWITTSCTFVATQLRMTRTTMLETIRMDYIRTARSKGQKEHVVITRHALRNALLPIITISGMELGSMLGGTATVETVFSLPGMGNMILEAIRMKDVPMVLGAVVTLCTCFTVIMLLVDVLYASIDPRIKARYVKR